MNEKKLMVKFECGHSQGFEKGCEPKNGNHGECRKCHYKLRRIVERSWVAAGGDK